MKTMNAPLVADKDLQERFDTECMLLGGLLSNSAVSHRAVAAILEPVHFSDPFNANLFRLIGEAVDAGMDGFQKVHWVITKIRELPAITELKATGSEIVARYIAHAAPQIGLEGCARLVRYDHLKGNLEVATEEGDIAEVERLAAEMERLSSTQKSKDEGIESIAQLGDRLLNKLNEAYRMGQPVKDFAYCGSADLGDLLGGWRRKRFYVIAGRPGMGKSSVTLSLLLRTAQKGHGVMFFALEMGREELTEMALASMAWSHDNRVEYRDISSAAVHREGFEEKFRRVLDVAPRLNDMPFLIGDRGGLTVAEVRSQALTYAQRLAAEGRKLEVVVIDHMGLMRASERYAGNKVSETEEISNGFKMLAKELDCAVIALAQINRGVEGRDDKRPGLSDLRWSGSVEQDADVVIFVYREAYYLERLKHDDPDDEARRSVKLGELRSRIEIIIAKHRGGPCGNIEMFCDMGCAVVRDQAVVGF